MPLPRRSLAAGALAAVLLSACAGAPQPPAGAPPAVSQPVTASGPGAPTILLSGPIATGNFTTTGVVSGSFTFTGPARAQACDPGDPMAFDPGPRVDSLAIRRVPGGWVAPMPNACPVDPRFQTGQSGSRYITVRGRTATPPAPR